MTILAYTQAELANMYGVVMQPQVGVVAAPTAPQLATAQGQRDRVTTLLRACPEVLKDTTDEHLLQINFVMGGNVPLAFTPQTRATLLRDIRSAAGAGANNFVDAGIDFPDPSNPKWASGAEGVADIVTAIGPIVTLITIIVQGEALNRVAVIRLATGALAVWCFMLMIYFLAKVPGIFGDACSCKCWQGDNERIFRNFLLFVVSILGIAFLLLQGTMISLGFKTKVDA